MKKTKKKLAVSDLVTGDIAEVRDYGDFGTPSVMSRFLVLGAAQDTCLWTYDHARWAFQDGDKACRFMDDGRIGVLFEDEEVELLVRAR